MRPNIIHNICIHFAIFNICILFSIFYIAIGTDSDIKAKSCWAHRLENAVVLRQVQFFFAELNRKYRERFNPFHATNLFLYPFKISDKQTISDVFKGDRRRPVASNGLILTFHIKQRHCVKSVRICSPGNTDQKNFEYGHFSHSTPNMDYKIFRIPIPIAVSFLTPKKWEKKLGHFGKISVICHEYITAVNIRYIYSFIIIICRV